MFKIIGWMATAIGLGVLSMARRGEGLGSAFFFLLGLVLLAFGLYLVFIEDGQGAARWLPFNPGSPMKKAATSAALKVLVAGAGFEPATFGL